MTAKVSPNADALKQTLLDRADQLAMLPAVASEALQLANDPECRTEELANVIERDVKLATETLKISNSVIFSASTPVVSLRQAVVRLGLKQVRNLIISSSAASLMKNMPLEQEWVREIVWQHSFRTATVASHLNQKMRFGFEGEEFTAGLLHDFGRLLLAVAAPEDFAEADPMSFEEESEFLSRERQVLGIDHCQFGAWFAEYNKLPRSLVAVIELHHLPETHHPNQELIALVAAADHLASHFQRYEENNGYDVGLNRGAHALSKLGHPELLEDRDQVIDEVFGEVLSAAGTDHSDLA
ncbi:HDOD domain-containing protein [Roseiconus lacunae]|uniref:HDOD domain-containing protein n=1 Tax=Roseiconus lacunae TaxID=2605694 RepID=UPI0011F2EF6E|nr:HDOD domain-containing protein [Roseiconus lacunae]MCD0463484.1 HDOD domain-containing protein [Roseiconus lacunae]WRQ53358.1 HDOD domain-containing protein [Stieleria sp. HD01]